jgi:hypothetical protein
VHPAPFEVQTFAALQLSVPGQWMYEPLQLHCPDWQSPLWHSAESWQVAP